MVYLLTNGKNYVMENPMKPGEFMQTTSSSQAKRFVYKRAKNLLQNKKKSLSWIRNFYMVDENGEVNQQGKYQRGNENIFVGKNDIENIDDTLSKVLNESLLLMNSSAWNLNQLKQYKEELTDALSKYDSAESDILHALQKYKEDNDGKCPQAHKMAKIGYVLDEIRDKHKNIKQCYRYIQVMENSILSNYTLEKLKIELYKVKNAEYKGRTEYYKKALNLLGMEV